jgi:hypothetical protein
VIVLIVLVLIVVAALVAVAAALVAVTPAVAKGARGRVVDAVRRGSPYAYEYVLKGPGTADEGDHDTDKLVVRADQHERGLIVVRLAPVDRAGQRTGRGRIIAVTR